jgi:hypothetical protein
MVVHTLLADSASHITQLRIDNTFLGAGIQGQVPKLVDSAPAPLLDPKEILDQINLNKTSPRWDTLQALTDARE